MSRMVCGNCEGKQVVKCAGEEYIICTMRDSERWNEVVKPGDTCLDWEEESLDKNRTGI